MEGLIIEYGDVVYGFCRKLTFQKEDAEDLYQQTFLKAYEMAEKIKKEMHPKSFLIAITIGIWKNDNKKRTRRLRIVPVTNNEELDIENMPGSMSVEDNVMQLILKEQINGKIRNLKETYRIPIILYYTLELSISEISSILHLPAGTVKSRLHKGRSILKKEMEGLGYE